jgi:hypothetical protein
MQPSECETTRVTLLLAAPSAVAQLAAPVLADHLGISTRTALQRLMASPGPIARQLAPQSAELLCSLLSALGLNPLIQPEGDRSPRCDLSIQRSIWVDPDRASRRLASALGLDIRSVDQAMGRPGGLMLTGLTLAEAQQMHQRLSAIRGLILLQSDRKTALYDVFATRPLRGDEGDALTAALRSISARPDPLSGACASGLDGPARKRLIAALPDLGLIALDRGVQRFDLQLVGVRGWVTQDLADFLVARTAQPRARFEVISPDEPVTLDRGLTHAVLRQFCADYAAIGLLTRPLLRGLSRFPDNPIL